MYYLQEDILSQLVIESIFLNFEKLDTSTKDKLYKLMKETIESYSVPLGLISRFIDICHFANKNETKVWSGHVVKVNTILNLY